MSIQLLPHQKQLLEETILFNRVAYYIDTGLGKTFIAGEKFRHLDSPIALVVCQKSKIEDWVEHFASYYDYPVIVFNKQSIDEIPNSCILVINYDSLWRRPDIRKLTNYTLILDESSYIINDSSERTKFILQLKPDNIILLSATPTGGKYEQLWAQSHLLGWKISKELYWRQYIETELIEDPGGYPVRVIVGYKNIDRLKTKLRQYGAVFMKYEESGLKLPKKVESVIDVQNTKEYARFKRERLITVNGQELVGDTALTKILYLRQLAGMYNPNKVARLKELLASINDRVILFYNFKKEYEIITQVCSSLGRPTSYINGNGKDITTYKQHSNSVTIVQYKSGAMGENLQLANKEIHFSPPLESILFEQSLGRIRREGQKSDTCFYYYLITINSIEEQIYKTLKQRKDFTDKLFEEMEEFH